MSRCYVLFALIAMVLAGGCSTPKGDTVADRRAYAYDMRDQALDRLYAQRPEVKTQIEQAPGYGVFSNIGTGFLILGTGNGYGVVTDTRSGKETFMRMFQVSGGLGVRLESYRAVFIFNSPSALDEFVTSGWEWGASGQASAKVGDTGGAATGQGSFNPIDVYTITESGIALRGSLAGTKYSVDKKMY
jgi:lipid-binding SYLF domain-containing protein